VHYAAHFCLSWHAQSIQHYLYWNIRKVTDSEHVRFIFFETTNATVARHRWICLEWILCLENLLFLSIWESWNVNRGGKTKQAYSVSSSIIKDTEEWYTSSAIIGWINIQLVKTYIELTKLWSLHGLVNQFNHLDIAADCHW
jgi:hypothetical protein